MRKRRLLSLLVMLFLAAPHVQAADWTTKGGGPERQSVNTDAVGLMEMTEAWRYEFGQSATQPVMVGQTIYHLAGPYLWRMEVTPTGELIETSVEAVGQAGMPWPEPVNMPTPSLTLISQSTPTYSPDSRMLYFGTAYGWLWAYHTEEKWLTHIDLGYGCPVVGSPLVLRMNNRDHVVVADRPNYPDEKADPGGRPLCSRSHGKVWSVSGLDELGTVPEKRLYLGPTDKSSPDGFGGFITPSAVAGLTVEGKPSFLVGADGFDGGRAILLTYGAGNALKRVWTADGSAGFAGTFTRDEKNAYWLDTAGRLWGAILRDGGPPTSWPAQSIDVPAAIGAGRVFTNTEPAIETRADGTHLYLTLRNWVPPGGTEAQLRADPTGSDGAVVAIGPGGQVKWFRRFGPTGGIERLSINTAPLAIQAQETLLFGDVQGNLYAQALDSARPSGGHPQPFLIAKEQTVPQESHSLLAEGETPAHGPFTFSQVSGVGVDPAMANGLILVGVNYTTAAGPGGRLVAYHVGPGYDLRWTQPPQPLELTPGQSASIANAVELRLTQQTLGAICGASIPVHWYLTDDAGAPIRPIGSSTLPGNLAPGSAWPIHIDLTLEPTDPQTGQVVGIIDHPGVVALSKTDTPSPAVLLARQIAAARGMATPKSCQGAAAEVKRLPDSDQPEAGLANNVLSIPWAKRVVRDDPYIDGIDHDPTPLGPDFGVTLRLGYRNNLGMEQAPVVAQVWLRQHPGQVRDDWAPVRVDLGCCDAIPITFTGIPEGEYDLIGEIAYEDDTNLSNNRVIYPIRVVSMKSTEGDGTGSTLTGGE